MQMLAQGIHFWICRGSAMHLEMGQAGKTKANTAPCCPWKASRGGTKQMILRSCFGLFFTCGKTRDKATEQERREVRTTSGKISLVIKFC